MKTEKKETLSKALSDFTYRNGYEISRVFDHFLQYIIWLHTQSEYGKPIKNWPYKPEESKEFFEMYQILTSELQEHLRHEDWFDVFGNIYEELIASKNRKSNWGQFFTPPSLCNLMTELTSPNNEEIVGKNISDCACGSGRNLLAFHVKHLGNYMIGEDIDQTCAMMTVCNFILHGVNGEVIWHNTLIPNSYYGGWRVNENLNNSSSRYSGVPHCRPMTREEYNLRFKNNTPTESLNDKRIKDKLTASLNKHVASLRDIMKGKLSREERKRQARLITMKIKNIKKLLEKYE